MVLEQLAARLNPDMSFSQFHLAVIADEVRPAPRSIPGCSHARPQHTGFFSQGMHSCPAPALSQCDVRLQICNCYSKHYAEGRGLTLEGLQQVRSEWHPQSLCPSLPTRESPHYLVEASIVLLEYPVLEGKQWQGEREKERKGEGREGGRERQHTIR